MERPDASENEFEQLALELFAYQFDYNAPYRASCDQRKRTPTRVKSWRDIPALTTTSFADTRIACFPQERALLQFVSSGTTSAGTRPSVHELEDPALYDASLLRHFKRYVMPDHASMRMLFLSPSFAESSRSSLAYMVSKIAARYATEAEFFIREEQLDANRLAATINVLEAPVLLFGTAFAFVHLLDQWGRDGYHTTLPHGSRIVETGGFKGKSRVIEREDFYAALQATFGVPSTHCLAEYGMCELGSQWYDAQLVDSLRGRTPRNALKVGPHWTRTKIVDPVTAEELPSGMAGLVQVVDLSNRGSVIAVLTGDMGIASNDGFVLLGRSNATPPKGCSISVDAMLSSHIASPNE